MPAAAAGFTCPATPSPRKVDHATRSAERGPGCPHMRARRDTLVNRGSRVHMAVRPGMSPSRPQPAAGRPLTRPRRPGGTGTRHGTGAHTADRGAVLSGQRRHGFRATTSASARTSTDALMIGGSVLHFHRQHPGPLIASTGNLSSSTTSSGNEPAGNTQSSNRPRVMYVPSGPVSKYAVLKPGAVPVVLR